MGKIFQEKRKKMSDRRKFRIRESISFGFQ